MLLFNVFIQNIYVSLHLFTNSILLYIIIYIVVLCDSHRCPVLMLCQPGKLPAILHHPRNS